MATGENQEYIVFPMAVMNITTPMNVGTHVNSYAIDIAGRDKNIESAFAPFTGTIKKKWDNGNSIWLESNSPVLFADGSVDYAVVMMTHDNSIKDLFVGQVMHQGVNFYQEGTAGQASGNHIHLGIGKGKFQGSGWYQNKEGYWVINNQIKPYEAFYLSGTEVINGAGYPWKSIEGGNMPDYFGSKEELAWSYRDIYGSEPSKKWIEDTWKAKGTYKDVTEGLKKYAAETGINYPKYKEDAEKEIAELKKQIASGSSEDTKNLNKIKEGLGLK